MFVLFEKGAIIVALEDGFFLGRINLPEEVELRLENRLVIQGIQSVKPAAFGFEILKEGVNQGRRGSRPYRRRRFGQSDDLVQVEVDRMEGERGNGGVRIGIQPGMARGCVVNGQNLNQLEARALAPI